MSETRIVILGAGGMGRSLLGVIRDITRDPRTEKKYDVVGFLDNDPVKQGQSYHGVEVCGPVSAAKELADEIMFVNSIGGPGYFWKLPDIISTADVPTDRFESIIHPDAYVATSASIGHGVIVFPRSCVYEDTEVGNHVQIFDANIGHDISVGDFSILQRTAEVGGVIEENCFIAKGSTIRDGKITIGSGSLVGIGAAVVEDVPEGVVVGGVPAEYIRDLTESSEQ
jgi:sugar O-acyltransferase (sialic acid O-acetyltransferase NeuD family)